MIDAERPLVLASASPRRAEILTTLRIPFEVQPSGVDECAIQAVEDAAFVRAVALAKLDHVVATLDEGRWALAADTMVCVDGRRLGQPEDDEDARRMIDLLQGREHRVVTGVVLGESARGAVAAIVVESGVRFRSIEPDEIIRYVATGEGRDKAGAYAVQGLASGFVEKLEGSYTNVVGLPAADVVVLLKEHGAIDAWP
ncbi:MAG: Maf family protein [Myxococcota bacterium]